MYCNVNQIAKSLIWS